MKQINKKYIGVIGERKTTEELYEIAYKIGVLIAKENWTLISGGRGGIMEASCKGSYENGGTTIGILPGLTREDKNDYLSYSIVTGLFEARNSVVVRSCDAIIAIAGSYGTLSEIGFANVYNIPVVGLKSWEIDNKGQPPIFIKSAETPEAAVRSIKEIFEGSI